MHKLVSTLAVLLLINGPVLSGSALAQSSDPAWLDELKVQAQALEQCEIDVIVRMQEGTLGGNPTYEARIRCADGRMFDANRIGSAGYFTFKTCDIQVC